LSGEDRQQETLSWNISAFSEDAALGKVKKRANEWLFNELTGNTWASSEDFNDFSTENNAKDIEMPEVQTPKIPLKAILSAFEIADSLDALKDKWQKAQKTEHAGKEELEKAYEKRVKELSNQMSGE